MRAGGGGWAFSRAWAVARGWALNRGVMVMGLTLAHPNLQTPTKPANPEPAKILTPTRNVITKQLRSDRTPDNSPLPPDNFPGAICWEKQKTFGRTGPPGNWQLPGVTISIRHDFLTTFRVVITSRGRYQNHTSLWTHWHPWPYGHKKNTAPSPKLGAQQQPHF